MKSETQFYPTDGMVVYTYAMLNRPAVEASPAGGNWIGVSYGDEKFLFGVVQYTRPLTPREVYSYEMALLDPLPDLPLYPDGTPVKLFNSGKTVAVEFFDGSFYAGDLELPVSRTWRSAKRWMMFEPVVIPAQSLIDEKRISEGYSDSMLRDIQAAKGISQTILTRDSHTPVPTHPGIVKGMAVLTEKYGSHHETKHPQTIKGTKEHLHVLVAFTDDDGVLDGAQPVFVSFDEHQMETAEEDYDDYDEDGNRLYRVQTDDGKSVERTETWDLLLPERPIAEDDPIGMAFVHLYGAAARQGKDYAHMVNAVAGHILASSVAHDGAPEPIYITFQVEVYFGLMDESWRIEDAIVELTQAEYRALPPEEEDEDGTGAFGQALYQRALKLIDTTPLGDLAFQGLYAYLEVESQDEE